MGMRYPGSFGKAIQMQTIRMFSVSMRAARLFSILGHVAGLGKWTHVVMRSAHTYLQ
jgi:hypothetical protein